MERENEITVTVKLVFSVNIPETIKTSRSVLADSLMNKLSVDVKWATIKNRTIVAD